jgi:hypothetical protein
MDRNVYTQRLGAIHTGRPTVRERTANVFVSPTELIDHLERMPWIRGSGFKEYEFDAVLHGPVMGISIKF